MKFHHHWIKRFFFYFLYTCDFLFWVNLKIGGHFDISKSIFTPLLVQFIAKHIGLMFGWSLKYRNFMIYCRTVWVRKCTAENSQSASLGTNQRLSQRKCVYLVPFLKSRPELQERTPILACILETGLTWDDFVRPYFLLNWVIWDKEVPWST